MNDVTRLDDYRDEDERLFLSALLGGCLLGVGLWVGAGWLIYRWFTG